MATMTPTYIQREQRGFSLRDGVSIILLIIQFLVLAAWIGGLKSEMEDMKEDVKFIKQQMMQRGINK